MNIIFLDIDGVLNFYSPKHPERYEISQAKMLMIADLARETNSQIVITSTWRLGLSIKYFQEIFWHFTHLSNTYFGYYWKGYEDEKIYLIDVTPRFSGCIRGMEIEYWLTAYEGTISNYVIIDDDDDMLPDQMNRFVKTNSYRGLTKKNIKQAKEILRSSSE